MAHIVPADAAARPITITSHVLDTSEGRPAAGVSVRLEQHISGETFKELGNAMTDADGRVKSFSPLPSYGVYRVTFHVGSYFAAKNQKCFYPYAHIVFNVTANEHYHIPLLLSPFGYTTYRGS